MSVHFYYVEEKTKHMKQEFSFLGELSLSFIYLDKKYFMDKEENCPYRALIIYNLKTGPSDSDTDG